MRLFTRLYRRPSEPATIEVEFDRVVYPVRLRRHRQARRYTLRIQASREVVLTMPLRGSIAEAKAFAHKNGAWIAVRLRRLPQAAPFAPGAVVPLRGVPHRVEHRAHARGIVWTEAADNGEHMLCVAGDRAHLARRVSDYLKRAAKHDLQAACRRYAADLGVAVKRVSVRDQSSRWGSCSSTGVLSFSWRLILAPPFVLDYLAAHEVTHLVEMNHSRRFWRLLLRSCPATQRAKAWLNAHGADLHRYGEPQPS